MKLGIIIVCLLVVYCCFTHRRVIKALIKHEEMPKAPNWHCWVKKRKQKGIKMAKYSSTE